MSTDFAGYFDILGEKPYAESFYDKQDSISFYSTHIKIVLVAIFCFLIFIYQLLLKYELDPMLPTGILWNILVYLTPLRLLNFLENYYNPLQNNNHTLSQKSSTHAAKRKAIQRILSLRNSSSLMSSVTPTENKGSTDSNAAAKGSGSRPAGLGNWDNSCYQNSILQGLASLKTLSEYLNKPVIEIDQKTLDRVEKQDTKMIEALRSLIEGLNSPSNNGKVMWTPASLKYMSSWQQQDAQEYFSKVLDEIDKEISISMSSVQKQLGFKQSCLEFTTREMLPTKLQKNPLEGLIAQRVGCLKCEFTEGLNLIPFNCLTVPLCRFKDHDISECLDEYTKLEIIEGVECGKCTLKSRKCLISNLLDRLKDSNADKEICRQTEDRLAAMNKAIENDDYEDKSMLSLCNITSKNRVTSTKSKQAVIARPPRSLVVHFNRSQYDEVSGDLRKNCCKIRFPKELDLGPWCLGSYGGLDDLSQEEWIMKPDRPMIASSTETSRQRGPIYELCAVVTHYGRHENGHYVCYKKYPVNSPRDMQDSWWRLSDDEVMKVSEANVLNQGGVFMLFYDCIEPACQDEYRSQLIDAQESKRTSELKKPRFPASESLSSILSDSAKEDSLLPADIALSQFTNDNGPESNSKDYSTSSDTPVLDEATPTAGCHIREELQKTRDLLDVSTTLQYGVWKSENFNDNKSGSRNEDTLSAGSTLVMI